MKFKISKRISTRRLATLLERRNVDIIYDAWAARGFKDARLVIDFETAAVVLKQYGHEAERTH